MFTIHNKANSPEILNDFSATGFIDLTNRAYVAHIGYLFVEQHTVCHRVPHTPLLNHIPILASILKLLSGNFATS